MANELDNFRAKFPEYNDIDDATLAAKLASKYPEYADLPVKFGSNTSNSGVTPEDYQAAQRSVGDRMKRFAIGVKKDIADPAIETVGMIGGGAVGTAAGGPIGSAAGGIGGYALGKEVVDLTDQWIGLRKAGSVPQEMTRVGKNVYTGAKLEAGGRVLSSGVNIAAKGAKMAYEKTMPFSKNIIEKAAGKQLIASTTYGPVYAKNAEEAARLEAEIPGLKFTQGAASNDPARLKIERSMAKGQGDAADLMKQRELENTNAIESYVKSKFGGGSIDDVAKQVEAAKAEINARVDTAKKGVQSEVERIGVSPPSQESGKAVRGTLEKLKGAARSKAKSLYDEIPQNIKLQSKDLDLSIKQLKKEFNASGDAPQDLPSGIIKQVEDIIRPKQATAGKLLDSKGNAIVSEQPLSQIPFGQLRGIRTQIREARRDATFGSNPNLKLDRRLAQLERSVEQTINQLEKGNTEVAKKFREASKFYKEGYVEPFRKGTVDSVLRPGNLADGYRVRQAEVAGQFFKPGFKNASDAADDLIRAVGKDKDAIQSVRDYASQDLYYSAVNKNTGELNPSGLNIWLRKHAVALKKFGLENEFKDIKSAQKILDDAAELKTAFDASAASRLIGSDVETAMQKALSTGNMGVNVNNLMKTVKGNKAAENGLKQGLVEQIMKSASTADPIAFAGYRFSHPKYVQAMKRYAPALRVMFKDEPHKIKALMDVRDTIGIMQRTVRPTISGGSDTAENVMGIVAGAGGTAIIGSKWALVNALRGLVNLAGSAKKHDVKLYLTRAVFDPEYAYTLMRLANQKPNDALRKKVIKQLVQISYIGGSNAMNNMDNTGE